MRGRGSPGSKGKESTSGLKRENMAGIESHCRDNGIPTRGDGCAVSTGCLAMQRHAVLQGLMQKQVMALSELEELCAGVTGTRDDDTLWDILTWINHKLKLTHFKVKVESSIPVPPASQSQSSSAAARYVALVNTRSDEAASKGSKFSHAELAYFKKVLEAMARADERVGEMPTMDLLNVEEPIGAPQELSLPDGTPQSQLQQKVGPGTQRIPKMKTGMLTGYLFFLPLPPPSPPSSLETFEEGERDVPRCLGFRRLASRARRRAKNLKHRGKQGQTLSLSLSWDVCIDMGIESNHFCFCFCFLAGSASPASRLMCSAANVP